MKQKLWYLVKRDFFSGMSSNRYKLLFVIVIFVTMTAINLFNENQEVQLHGGSGIVAHNVVDYIFQVFKGAEIGPTLSGTWLVSQLYVAFLVGSFITEDLNLNGPYLLTRSGSRMNWWSSKVLWMIATVVVYYLLAFLSVAVTASFQHPLSLQWSEYAQREIVPLMSTSIGAGAFVGQVFLLVVTSSIAVSMLQIAVALIVRPFFSFLITTALLVASLFFDTWMLPGSHSMVLRHALFAPQDGYSIGLSLLYNVVLALLFFIVGGLYFKRADVLSKEDTE